MVRLPSSIIWRLQRKIPRPQTWGKRFCNDIPCTTSRSFCSAPHAYGYVSNEDKVAFSVKSLEDRIFDSLKDKKSGKVPIPRLIGELQSNGIMVHDIALVDPRLREFRMKLDAIAEQIFTAEAGADVTLLNKEDFKELTKDNVDLIGRAITGDLVIPDFPKLSKKVDDIYYSCSTYHEGKVADYIPQLSRFSPDFWGVSICTVDGQRHNIGDTAIPFCIQSCSKPLTYAIGLNELGPEVVHQYIGQEPSGRGFNEISLDFEQKPHNPMINAGAIIMASLVKNTEKLPDRFDYISRIYKKLAGGEFLGFNNSVYLSERETADRNFALAFYMRENKCFPEGLNMNESMDLYFQMCSVEATCQSASVIAATLANGGICPTTQEKVLSAESVRDTLSLMYSCGMYDYSGQFAFKVGLPAKSGVSGCILLVIPNVMGIAMWSPPLDRLGNSVRGLHFCEKIVDTYNFHNYDILTHTPTKEDPRKNKSAVQSQQIMTLLFGAYNGDLGLLRRESMRGTDMSQMDYDKRTVLHVASAEGHTECVRFLVDQCELDIHAKDRWGQTALTDAVEFGHQEVVDILEAAGACSPP